MLSNGGANWVKGLYWWISTDGDDEDDNLKKNHIINFLIKTSDSTFSRVKYCGYVRIFRLRILGKLPKAQGGNLIGSHVVMRLTWTTT